MIHCCAIIKLTFSSITCTDRELKFVLDLNTAMSSACDTPSYLDQGVRLEVRRAGGRWEPIRFYAASKKTSASSLVTLTAGGDRVEVTVGSLTTEFPLYVDQSYQPLSVTEYLCGSEYYDSSVEFRWSQHYTGDILKGDNSWSLHNVSISHWTGDELCRVGLTQSHFAGLSGASWSAPSCRQQSGDQLALYFSLAATSEGRSATLGPGWNNRSCSTRNVSGQLKSI